MTIVATLEAGPLRFNELRRRTGATQKMLTQTLRMLERDGYVLRSDRSGKVLEVHYELSGLGVGILEAARTMAASVLPRLREVEAARREYDVRLQDDL